MLGRVGQDMYGDFIIAKVKEAGLNSDFIIRDPNAHTGIGHLRVAPDGEYETVVVQGANDNISGQDFDTYLGVHGSPSFVITNLETPISAIRHIAGLGVTTSLAVNVSPMVDGAKEALQLANLAVLNLSEAKTLLGIDFDALPRDLLNQLRKITQATLVITLGEQGAIALDQNDGIFEVHGEPVKVINTIGAGDSFFATLVMALSTGASISEAMAAGNQAGRLVCQRSESHISRADAEAIRVSTGLNF